MIVPAALGLGSYVRGIESSTAVRAGTDVRPAIKGVGIGIGPKAESSRLADARRDRSRQDEPAAYRHLAADNNAGGLEGGVTMVKTLRISGFMKPIATLMKPLRSVDLEGMKEAPAVIERSDVCAISAAQRWRSRREPRARDAFLEKFSGDSLGEIQRTTFSGTDRLQARFTTRKPAAPPLTRARAS